MYDTSQLVYSMNFYYLCLDMKNSESQKKKERNRNLTLDGQNTLHAGDSIRPIIRYDFLFFH